MDIKETEWYQGRPTIVQRRIDEYPPQFLYRKKDTGHVVELYSYDEGEDGLCKTCTILILQKNNDHMRIAMERRVFGVPFDDLERLEQWRDNGKSNNNANKA